MQNESAHAPSSADVFRQELEARRRAGTGWRRRPGERVTRRVCLRIGRGETETLPAVDETLLVRCARGSVWITHDGDPRDVVLDAQQSYRADRADPLRLHALQPAVVEIEFEASV